MIGCLIRRHVLAVESGWGRRWGQRLDRGRDLSEGEKSGASERDIQHKLSCHHLPSFACCSVTFERVHGFSGADEELFGGEENSNHSGRQDRRLGTTADAMPSGHSRWDRSEAYWAAVALPVIRRRARPLESRGGSRRASNSQQY